MARITFVYPDFESIGVEYLMAICINEGHNVNFVYYHVEDISFGMKNKHISYQSIAKKIAVTQPHIVAFSCVTDNYQAQLSCARAIKEIKFSVGTIFGGIHPSAVPELVLRNPEVDCVAIGEAEKSFPAFLNQCRIQNNVLILPDKPIKGIVHKVGGKFLGEFQEGELPDVNMLPFPHKSPFYAALKAFSRVYHIMTSRGCPYACSYCFNAHLRDLRGRCIIRQRTVDNVIAELLHVKKKYSPQYVIFLDDCFTTNDRWMLEFCERYRKEINLPFACISIPRYLNRKKIKALSLAGCINIQIGLQSLDKEICSEILHRKSDNAKTAEVIKTLKDAGIMVQVDHMLGIPTDTLEIQEKSILFYNEHRPDLISIFWLTYYPQTPIVDIAKQKGLLSENDMVAIEEGRGLTERSSYSGGSMKDPRSYYGIAFLLNYLPLLPKWLVSLLVRRHLYVYFQSKFLLSTVIPRTVSACFNRKDFRGRTNIARFIDKVLYRR